MRRRRITRHVPVQTHTDGPAPQSEVWVLRSLLFRNHLVDFVRGCIDSSGIQDVVGRALEDVLKLTPTGRARFLTRRLKAVEARGVVRDLDVFANVETLGSALGLTPAEREILAFAVLLDDDPQVNECVKPLLEKEGKSFRKAACALAAVLGLSALEVEQALTADHNLAKCGLVRYSPEACAMNSAPFEVADHIRSVLRVAADASQDLLTRLLAVAAPSSLTWDDFRHIEKQVALVKDYLARSHATRRKGVNLLFYGVPGVGKTELGRLAGRECGARVYEVGNRNDQRSAMDRDDRLRNYLLCQALASTGGPAVILFDEIEDVFRDSLFELFGHSAPEDKAWTNRLLEENPVPTIWISNRIDHMDPAFLRRFDLIVEVEKPPRDVRERILADRLESIPYEQAWLSRLVRDDRATPADLDRAANVVRTLGRTDAQSAQACVEQVLDMNLQARLGRKPAGYRHDPSRYDLGLVNTSVSLPSLVSTLKVRRRGTACLYGSSGTGKTAFAHQVGVELGLPVVLRRGSDLLSMWVGGTEQNIAQMFQEARDEGAILLLDEADSFLRDRRMAHQSWEVTQVNELLVQMEAFDGIFFCSTNLIDDFDRAAFRRFALKVRFDPLKIEQRRVMFRRLMDRLQPDAGRLDDDIGRLERLEGLTPGDFTAVEGRYELLGQNPTVGEVLGALAEELEVRSEGRGRSLGFTAR